jgi:hypothetical protein
MVLNFVCLDYVLIMFYYYFTALNVLQTVMQETFCPEIRHQPAENVCTLTVCSLP